MIAFLLAYVPLLHAWPTEFPTSARLWTFLPLAAAIAVVYRGTRSRNAHDVAKGAFVTFASIVVGMAVIAVGFYVLYEVVIRYF